MAVETMADAFSPAQANATRSVVARSNPGERGLAMV